MLSALQEVSFRTEFKRYVVVVPILAFLVLEYIIFADPALFLGARNCTACGWLFLLSQGVLTEPSYSEITHQITTRKDPFGKPAAFAQFCWSRFSASIRDFWRCLARPKFQDFQRRRSQVQYVYRSEDFATPVLEACLTTIMLQRKQSQRPERRSNYVWLMSGRNERTGGRYLSQEELQGSGKYTSSECNNDHPTLAMNGWLIRYLAACFAAARAASEQRLS